MRRFYEALEYKGWSENVDGIYDDYNGEATDSQVVIVQTWGLKDAEEAKFFKFIDAVCEANNWEWNYQDQTTIDYDDNCAYADGYGEQDYIMNDCEIMGKRRFDNKELSFDDLIDDFYDNPERAIPSWVEVPEGLGWEQQSCDFENGWYGRNDNPEEILKKLSAQNFNVIFQLDYVNPFATGFCVWVRKIED